MVMFRVTDVDSDVADWFGLEVRPDGRSNVHEYDRLLGVGTGLLYSRSIYVYFHTTPSANCSEGRQVTETTRRTVVDVNAVDQLEFADDTR